jgi:hypothetical protein
MRVLSGSIKPVSCSRAGNSPGLKHHRQAKGNQVWTQPI